MRRMRTRLILISVGVIVALALVVTVTAASGTSSRTVLGRVAPPAAARPAHFVEPFENGVTVGLAIPCPQHPLRIVATVHWSNSAPRKLTANTCSGNPREDGANERLKWGGSNVELTTNPARYGPPGEPYTIGPRLVAEVTSLRHHAKWLIFFRLTEGDTYLESGTIFLYTKHVSARRRVWQGEEPFVTYCINQHQKITSINHRLGCYLPPVVYTTEKVRWAH
jgi:hypothetical protein